VPSLNVSGSNKSSDIVKVVNHVNAIFFLWFIYGNDRISLPNEFRIVEHVIYS
jgi:hypothetical protein